MDDAAIMAKPDGAGQSGQKGPQGIGRTIAEKLADLGPLHEPFGQKNRLDDEAAPADLAVSDRGRGQETGLEKGPRAVPGAASLGGRQKRLEPSQAANAEFLYGYLKFPAVQGRQAQGRHGVAAFVKDCGVRAAQAIVKTGQQSAYFRTIVFDGDLPAERRNEEGGKGVGL